MLWTAFSFPRAPGLQPAPCYHLPDFLDAGTLLESQHDLGTQNLHCWIPPSYQALQPCPVPQDIMPTLCLHLYLMTHLPLGGHIAFFAPCQQLGWQQRQPRDRCSFPGSPVLSEVTMFQDPFCSKQLWRRMDERLRCRKGDAGKRQPASVSIAQASPTQRGLGQLRGHQD